MPSKVKDLLWRAASNCLPTKTQLRSRHVNVEANCLWCQYERESIAHCLVQCSFARSCWHQVDAVIDINVVGSFAAWLADLLRHSDNEKGKVIAMTCWAL